MLPDFNRLKVFYHVFTHTSVAGAARELHVTQSAVSQHLQKLESELDTALFTRLHKQLVPTAAGERLYGIVKPFVAELETGLRHLEQARDKPYGLLRLGAPREFGKEYLPGIFASFRRACPDVTFYLKLENPVILLSMMAEGKLDFAITDTFSIKGQFYGDLSNYAIEPMVEEEVILACSRRYYDQEIRGDHTFGNLIRREFISYYEGTPVIRSWFKHHYNRSLPSLTIVLQVENVHAVSSGILHHMGLGIIPSHLFREEIQSGAIQVITTDTPPLINRISLVQLQDKIPTPAEKAFQKHFRNEIDASGLLRNFLKIS